MHALTVRVVPRLLLSGVSEESVEVSSGWKEGVFTINVRLRSDSNCEYKTNNPE